MNYSESKYAEDLERRLERLRLTAHDEEELKDIVHDEAEAAWNSGYSCAMRIAKREADKAAGKAAGVATNAS